MSNKVRIRYALFALPMLLAVACGPAGGEVGPTAPANQPGPVERFTAEVTSPVSVMLRWPAGADATQYVLEVKYGEQGFLPLVEVSADQTSYEDLPAPDGMDLTYRLQVVTSAGESEGGTAVVTTPVQEPNPLTVQAHQYEPTTWEPPAVDFNDPNFDPSSLYPPGFDPDNPEAFDPSSMMVVPSATALIGPEGGSVSVTSPDKMTFTLEVPPEALDEEAPITLVPIQSIDGLPLSGGLLGAVRIEPEGLFFDLPAILTIESPDGGALSQEYQALGFAFEGEGQEFHLHPFSPEAGTARGPSGAGHRARGIARPLAAGPLAAIAAAQARSYGVGSGTKADAQAVVRNHRPTANDAAIANRLAYGQVEVPELHPLATPGQLSANRILESANNAISWNQVMEVLDNFEFHNQFYGNDKASQATREKIWDVLLDRLNKMLEQNLKKCFTAEDFNAHALAERMTRPKSGSFGAQMAQRFKQKYGDQVLKDVMDSAKQCKLELRLDSRITAQFPGVGTFEVPFQGTLPLKWRWNGRVSYLTGQGTMAYEEIRIRPETCAQMFAPAGTEAYVTLKMTPVFASGGGLVDFTLAFDVKDKKTIQFSDFRCEDASVTPPPVGGRSFWHGLFTAAHFPDLDVIDWTMQAEGEKPTATKEWDRQGFKPSMGWGTWSETSTFELRTQ